MQSKFESRIIRCSDEEFEDFVKYCIWTGRMHLAFYGFFAMLFCFFGFAEGSTFSMLNAGFAIFMTWRSFRKMTQFCYDIPLMIRDRDSYKEYAGQYRGKDS